MYLTIILSKQYQQNRTTVDYKSETTRYVLEKESDVMYHIYIISQNVGTLGLPPGLFSVETTNGIIFLKHTSSR